MNEQDIFGSIVPGKRAGFVVVDRDILAVSPEELRDAKVVWTMASGRIVYPTN